MAGSVTLVKLAQLEKARPPRLVTESGSTIAASPDPLNAVTPTLVTAFGMAIVRSAVQDLKQERGTTGSVAGSVTRAKLAQPRNALAPRPIIESGSTIVVSPDS